MYPLKVCLIGCTDGVLPEIRRELQNHSAPLEGEWPDMRSGLAELSSLPSGRRLLIVQPQSSEDTQELERLNEGLLGQPILALVDLAVDPAMFVRAMRAGAAQVVRVPLQSADFQDALRRIAIQFGNPLTQSRVVAVCGVTGGCGATTIAVNLTAEIAYLHKLSCILMETSFHLGRLAVFLNMRPKVTISDLLKDLDRVDLGIVRQALAKVSDNFQVLVGSYSNLTQGEATLPDILRLHGYVRQLADVVVVDMPYTYGDTYLKFLENVNDVVLVAEQKSTSIIALKMMLDSLEKRKILATPHVVVNRYKARGEDLNARRIGDLLGVSKIVTIANDYASVIASENKGRPIRQLFPGSPVLSDLDALACEITGRTNQPALNLNLSGQIRGACSSLAGWFGLR